MKKLILIFTVALISLVTFGQSVSPYHNLIVNEKIHTQGDSINSCYVVIHDVSVLSLKNLNAAYIITVYKAKSYYQTNPDWSILTTEIPSGAMIQFDAEFTQGDLFEKISDELITYLLKANPTWEKKNITKE